MKLVLTNDDGIGAPGLLALENACLGWAELRVVAPDRCHSSMSHHVITDKPIQVAEVAPGRFSVGSGPADCARLARTCLALDADWLISGINRGGNLGMDTCYSGTVAAAREAALLGWPAVAISHFVARGREVDWELASLRASRVLRDLMGMPLAAGEFWNVNLPHGDLASPEIVFCELDPSALPVRYSREGVAYQYSGQYSARSRIAGHDVELCFDGATTITKLRCGF